MQISTIILALSAAVSAIDIRLHVGVGNTNCGNTYLVCVGLNPGVCCANSGIVHNSAAFVAIPSNWNIRTMGFYSGGCNALSMSGSSSGATYKCLAQPNSQFAFSGARYEFIGKRRSEQAQCTSDGESSSCTVAKPNLFVLEGTTEYDLVDMPDTLVETLVCNPPPLSLPLLAISKHFEWSFNIILRSSLEPTEPLPMLCQRRSKPLRLQLASEL